MINLLSDSELGAMSGLNQNEMVEAMQELVELGYIKIREDGAIEVVNIESLNAAYYSLPPDQRPQRTPGTVWGIQDGNLVEFAKIGGTYHAGRIVLKG